MKINFFAWYAELDRFLDLIVLIVFTSHYVDYYIKTLSRMNISNSIYNVSKVSNSSFDYMLYNYRNITSPLTQSIMILLTALITVLGLTGNSLVVFATTR